VNAMLWLPLAVFLGVSIPLVLLLNAFGVGGEHLIWIAIGAGALATAFTQSRLQNKKDQE
jgi:Na+-driven multidrug efflux pump